MARLVDGSAPDATPLERALVYLARRTVDAPATLSPADLAPLRALAGDGALDYALVVGAFHFINRIADLLHVDPEVLPAPLRRFEPLRRLAVRAASFLMARWDLANRPYTTSFDEAAAAFARVAGRDVHGALAPLRARPKLVEALRLALEERERSTLGRETLARIHRAVEAALPAAAADREGFQARPRDPFEAFAFVGTRWAYRATEELVAGLRATGLDDAGVLDAAIAVADANQWARLFRLCGLPADLYSLA